VARAGAGDVVTALGRAAVAAAALVLVAASCGSDAPAPDAAASTGAAVATTESRTTDAHTTDAHTTDAASDAAAVDPVAFHADMRKLWEDHVTWTRLYLVSAIAGLPDTEATAGRLLQNQADIGAAVASFYGDEAGAAVTDLLRQHILIAADLVTAAKAGDETATTQKKDEWYANADEIAAYLAAANPAWPEDTLQGMMRTHLDQTLAEATARLTGDWQADIAAYDEIHEHILRMADALADGIVAQFPERFSS
jgi:hypothetical protein